MIRRASGHLLPHRVDRQIRHIVIASLLAVAWILLLLGISVILKRLVGTTLADLTLALSGPTQSRTADPDQRLQDRLVGTWRDFHHGQRTLTVREDGTATMVVELQGMKARLFTPRLQLEMAWSIKDGCMIRRTTGGKPASKVAFVNRYAGAEVTEPVLKLTDRQLVLLDQDGSTTYDWQRVDGDRARP